VSRPLDPRLLREARGARVAVGAAVGLGLVTTALVLVQAGLLARVLARALLEPDAGLGELGPELVALSAVVAARAATSWLQARVAVRCSADVKSTLRARLVRHAQELGPSWLAGERGGELATLVTRGVDALDPWFSRYLPQLVLAVLVPVAVLVRLATVDLLSAVVVAVTLPLIPLFMVLVGLHTQQRTARSYDRLAALSGHFLDAVRGMKTLRVHGRAAGHAQSVRRASDAHRRATIGTLRIAFLSALVLELLATLSVALVAVEVGLRLVHGSMPYESALLVLLLAPEAYLPLRRVGAEHHACQDGADAADRVFAVLETQPDVQGSAPLIGGGPVALDGVTVELPGRDCPVLEDVDLVLARGERVAVVGPSGAGKSTLLDVLLRFRAPDQGRLLLGGDDVDGTDPSAWRARTAWLPRAPYLFPGTVADNVRLGAPDATDAAVARALVAVQLPGTEQVRLGEDGVGLSAGQRRRIALARALLRVDVLGASLLLLDEPTESLDAVSAAAVRTALTALPRTVAVVAVTHDAGLAAACDRVVVLESGRVGAERRPAAVVPEAS
jgi:thiol reductant ABC exporter CydD subunit